VIVLILPADGGTTRVLVPAHDRLRRDFDRFDAPEIVRDDAVDRALIERFQQEETARHTTAVVSATLPEEALAPLYFLSGDATLPITVLRIAGDDLTAAAAVGSDLAAATDALARRAVLVAVGELSSKLFPGAPGGFSTAASAFDQDILDRMRAGRWGELAQTETIARRDAGEHLLPQLATLAGALPRGTTVDILGYQFPYGVGYLVAAFHP